MRTLLIPALVVGALLLVSAPLVGADPNLDLDPIPPHRHFIETASGELVEVGPRLCDDPSLQDAFNQFHSNVHHALSPLSPIGAVPGPGPVEGAPGLDNGLGADITFRGCSFVP